MKTFLHSAARFVMVAAVASFGLANSAQARATANEPETIATTSSVAVDPLGKFVYLVRVTNPEQQASRVQLVRSNNNQVLYESNSHQPVFGCKLDVSNLPDGEYVLVVKTGKQAQRFPLSINTVQQRSSQLSVPALALR